MLKIKLIGHNYEYEIDEIIKLFIENTELHDFEILSYLKVDGDIIAETKIFQKDVMISENTISAVNKDFSDIELRKLSKRLLKISLFKALKKVIQKSIPWGILTGIRPTKIVHEFKKEGLSNEKIYDVLVNQYEIHGDKAELTIDVAGKELNILNNTPKKSISIYIGIPFCPTRCLYCSFTSNPLSKYGYLVDSYLDALFKEMSSVKKLIEENNWVVQTIYVGGGTPTSLDELQLEKFLNAVNENFNISSVEEFTFEAGRPDTINKQKLQIIKNYGIERISINPQSMNIDTLKTIGRLHSPEDIIQSFRIAKEIGFDVNMDIIVGLPGENDSHIKETMIQIEKLDPENLTVHTMAVKRASNLKQNIDKFTLSEAEKIERMLDIAREYSNRMGMYPYYLYRQKNMVGSFENVGYCKPNKECIYNIQIMDEQQTILALGAGATSKIVFKKEGRIERIFNVKNVEEYIKRIDEMIQRKNEYNKK